METWDGNDQTLKLIERQLSAKLFLFREKAQVELSLAVVPCQDDVNGETLRRVPFLFRQTSPRLERNKLCLPPSTYITIEAVMRLSDLNFCFQSLHCCLRVLSLRSKNYWFTISVPMCSMGRNKKRLSVWSERRRREIERALLWLRS